MYIYMYIHTIDLYMESYLFPYTYTVHTSQLLFDADVPALT